MPKTTIKTKSALGFNLYEMADNKYNSTNMVGRANDNFFIIRNCFINTKTLRGKTRLKEIKK